MTLLQRRIMEARNRNGWSQQKLADKILISYRTIIRWMRPQGYTYPQDMILSKLVELKVVTDGEAEAIKHERYKSSQAYAKLQERVNDTSKVSKQE